MSTLPQFGESQAMCTACDGDDTLSPDAGHAGYYASAAVSFVIHETRPDVGLYFEDFVTERTFVSVARTIEDREIVSFASLTGDAHPLHLDDDYARRSPFGRRIVHGAFVFSVSIGLTTAMDLVNDTLVAFYGVDRMRFTKPVYIGDSVTVEKRVSATRPTGRHNGLVSFHTTVRNQHGDTVLTYEDTLIVRRRVE